MARQPARKPAKRPRLPAEPRRTAASEEARSGLAGVTERLDEWVTFFKSIGWMLAIVVGTVTFCWNFVGKPWAQDLITTTVAAPLSNQSAAIDALQKQIADLRVSIEEGKTTDIETKAQLQALIAQLEMLQRIAETGQQNQQQILELLQKPK